MSRLGSPPLATTVVNPQTGQNNPAWMGWILSLTTKVLALIAQSEKTIYGTGSPEGVVIAEPGTLYINTLGGTSFTFWVKEIGSSDVGWSAK
jgi:hypothetical protein